MILSIVIPVYNAQDYIERCIDSLLNQDLTVGEYEIIAINDGSKDDSLKILSRFAKEYEQVKVIDQANIGLGATRNVGLDHARGTYIYYIDADDYLASGMLQPIMSIASGKDLDVVTFNTWVVDNDSTYKDSRTSVTSIPAVEVMDGKSYIGALSYKNEAWWYITKTNFIKELNLSFVEGKWMEDSVYTTTLFLAASRMAHVPLDVHRYVRVENSILRNKDPEHYIKVIYDTEYVIHEFSRLITEAKKNAPDAKACLDILKTRRDSFVFFVIIRVFRSQLSFKDLWEMLMRIKQEGGYPINHFVGKEYNKPVYKILTPLMNKKFTLKALFKLFRLSKR